MRKRLMVVLLLVVAMLALAACSSGPDYNVKVTKDLYFSADKAKPIEIKVTENGKAVKGLDVSAEFSMANMDHGTYKMKFTEGKDGTYAGIIKLPMNGKYEIAFTMKKDGKSSEKVINYVVKKPEGVALLNGKWITHEDVDFYKFVNYLQLAMKREDAGKKYKGKELDEELSYLEKQEKNAEDQNMILTEIIRLSSMALLAEEKGHKVSDAETDALVSKVRGQYKDYATAQAMIKEYGEDKFWKQEREQVAMMVLNKMVQQDLTQQVKKENPQAGEQEVTYLMQEKYEELLVSQVNSLKIEIL